jgi:hypothetical protein
MALRGDWITPMAKGVVCHPQIATPKKKKRKKKKKGEVLGFWGWLDYPQGPGVRPPQALVGGPATPKAQNTFFFFFWQFGGGRTTTIGHGGGSATPRPADLVNP